MYPLDGIKDDEETHLPSCILTKDKIPEPQMRPVIRFRPRCQTDFSLAYEITNALWKKEDLDNFLVNHPRFDLNSFGRIGYTVLSVAMGRSYDLVLHVLNLEPHLARETCYYDMPYIVKAATIDSLKLVQLFIAHGADPRAPTANGRTALGESAERAENIELTKYLLLEGSIVYDKYRQHILRGAHIWGDRTPERVRDQKKNIADAITSIREDYMAGTLRQWALLLHELTQKNEGKAPLVEYLRRLPDEVVVSLVEFWSTTQHKRANFLDRISNFHAS